MPQPVQVLQTIHGMLSEGGILLIRVPNIDSLESRLFGSRWFQIHLPGHCFHFNPRSLKQLLDRGGFDVVKLDTNFTPQGAISAACSIFPCLGSAFLSNIGIGRGKHLIMRGVLAVVSLVLLPLVFVECMLGRGPVLTVMAQRRERR